MHRPRKGIPQTSFLIVFITLTFVASGIAYLVNSSLEDQKKLTSAANRERAEWQGRFQEKWEEVRKLRELLGYYDADADPLATETDLGLLRSELDRINATSLPAKVGTTPLTVKIMFGALERALNRLKRGEQNAILVKENLEQRLRAEEEAQREMVAQKNRDLANLRDRARRDKELLNRSIAQQEGQITELRDRNHSLHGYLEQCQGERVALAQKLGTQVKSLRGRLDKVLEKESRARTLIPDGEVIRSDVDHGFAYIDIGWKHGAKAGSRFRVYAVLKGGIRKEKGVVRILRLEKDFSQCAILDMPDPQNPIVRGDLVWNKFFEAGISRRFVFVGNFDVGARYSKEQLRQIILENGHVVSDAVRADTDYAVLGDDFSADPNWNVVKEFNVDRIRARTLLEFFGPGTCRK
jgi:hypothetical protein